MIPDSGKTLLTCRYYTAMFESDVIPDSGKTDEAVSLGLMRFESDVILDSGKTAGIHFKIVQ